jgi:RHS repeat-associated protein
MSKNGSLRFVVALNALAAGYDANGNMTLRLKDGARYFLAYDAESRLTSVSGTVSASFAYNGDGQRVTSTIGTAAITTYIGGYFEWKDGVGTSYYFAGAQRIAMRTGTDVKFLLGDHLGSTSVTAYASGAFDTETRYYPWGRVRYSYGTTPTDYRFTGQQEIVTIGLYFYNSRFYDAALGRFVSPDSIIPNPGDPVSFDRFAYVRNNPLMYIDPSGHYYACGEPDAAPTLQDCQEINNSNAEPSKSGLSRELTNSEIRALVMLIAIESSSGEVPIGISFMKAWALLNRLTYYSNQINRGSRTVIGVWGTAERGALLDYGLTGTDEENFTQLVYAYNNWRANGSPSGSLTREEFLEIDDAVRLAVTEWSTEGPGSRVDPTQGGLGFAEPAEDITPRFDDRTTTLSRANLMDQEFMLLQRNWATTNDRYTAVTGVYPVFDIYTYTVFYRDYLP